MRGSRGQGTPLVLTPLSVSPVRWFSPLSVSPVRWFSPLSVSPVRWSSPPVPLSLRERGNEARTPERPAQQRRQVVTCYIAVCNADHSIARGLEGCGARGIIRPSFTPRVRRAVKLEHQPLGGAVEVNDEPMHHVLAPKLEAEDAPIPQQRPRVSLSGRRRASQLARLRKLPAAWDTPEWSHRAHTRAASSRPRTGTPRHEPCCCSARIRCRELAPGSPSPEWRGGKGGEDSRTVDVRGGQDSRTGEAGGEDSRTGEAGGEDSRTVDVRGMRTPERARSGG